MSNSPEMDARLDELADKLGSYDQARDALGIKQETIPGVSTMEKCINAFAEAQLLKDAIRRGSGDWEVRKHGGLGPSKILEKAKGVEARKLFFEALELPAELSPNPTNEEIDDHYKGVPLWAGLRDKVLTDSVRRNRFMNQLTDSIEDTAALERLVVDVISEAQQH